MPAGSRFAPPEMRIDPPALERMTEALRGLLRHDPLMARSRKVSARGVSSDRVLLTFPKAALIRPDDPWPLARIVGADLPDRLLRHWKQAEVIHLGLDEADTLGGSVRKLYLELLAEETPEPGLVYLALKVGTEPRLNRYDTVADPGPLLASLDLPSAMAGPAHRLARLGDLLRVSEEGTPRLSLDIGLADCDPDAVACASLERLVRGVNPAADPPAFWPSHVAIGRDRERAVFVTLYGWPDGKLP